MEGTMCDKRMGIPFMGEEEGRAACALAAGWSPPLVHPKPRYLRFGGTKLLDVRETYPTAPKVARDLASIFFFLLGTVLTVRYEAGSCFLRGGGHTSKMPKPPPPSTLLSIDCLFVTCACS